MKIWAVGFISLGALGVIGAPNDLLRWHLRGPFSAQAQQGLDHLGSLAMMAGIGLIVLGVVLWIAEPEPLLSTKPTRRHHVIAATTSAVGGVLYLLTMMHQPVWWRWPGAAVLFVGMAVEVVKAVRFTTTPRP
jgi:hypothetical protein